MGSWQPSGWMRRTWQAVGGPIAPAIRLLVWFALVLVVALSSWALVSRRRERARGIPHDFPAPVTEADVPSLGVNVALSQYSERQLDPVLSRVADGGFVWVRQSFFWSQIKGEGPSGGFHWSNVDAVMRALARHPSLRLVAVLDDTPPVPPADPDQFAAFAGAFAERYGDHVDYYQVWDEPNLAEHWGDGPVNPSGYADLLSRTARAIRRADPDACILLAGLAPTREVGLRNMSEVRYLERLYQAGAAPYFDIVAAKPYGFDSGPYDRRVDESLLNVSRVLLLRDVMVERGDAHKAIWASHWGWNSLPKNWNGSPSIWGQTDEVTQAARSVAMLERARREWPWMGAMIIETLQPGIPASTAPERDLEDPRWGFSLLAPDGTPRPVYHALADWARSVPDAAPVGGYMAGNRWARYEGKWRAGPIGAGVSTSPAGEGEQTGAAGSTGDRASFRFDGSRVALTIRRGPYRAFLFVTVDGEPASALPRDENGRAYVVLYDSQSSVTTVPLATDLEPGVHTVEVAAEGGEGQWPLVDWRVGAKVEPDEMLWMLAGLAAASVVLLVLLVRDARRVRWSSLAVTFLRLPSGGQAGLVGGLTASLWAAAALSWGRATPDDIVSMTCFVVSLVILPILASLFALRLDLGLALVALLAPFYLVPESMFYRALSMPEALIGLCCAGRVGLQVATRGEGSLRWRSGISACQRYGSGPSSFTALDLGVALLVLSALASGAAADDTLGALFELRSVFVLPALYYGLLRVAPLDRGARRRIVGAFALGGVGVAAVGLVQYALGQNLVLVEDGLLRLQSVYHSPNSVGLYLGRVWPILAVGAWFEDHRRRRTLSILALFVATLALGLSFSRGALLLALPASVLAMGCLAGGRFRRVSALLLGLAALLLVPALCLPRFANLLDLGRGTTFFRLKLWRSSLSMIGEHPLLGVGPGNFLDAYRTRYVLPTAWEEFNLEHAHNILLGHWTRLGVLGVAAGLALQVAFWRAVTQQRRDPMVVGLVGSMAALLGHGLVDNAVFFPDLALAFFLTLAMVAADRPMRDS